jgi:hypothetical protein
VGAAFFVTLPGTRRVSERRDPAKKSSSNTGGNRRHEPPPPPGAGNSPAGPRSHTSVLGATFSSAGPGERSRGGRGVRGRPAPRRWSRLSSERPPPRVGGALIMWRGPRTGGGSADPLLSSALRRHPALGRSRPDCENEDQGADHDMVPHRGPQAAVVENPRRDDKPRAKDRV